MGNESATQEMPYLLLFIYKLFETTQSGCFKGKNAYGKFIHCVTIASESLQLKTEICNGNCNSFLTMPVYACCSKTYSKML